jgi:hypothetical protein
VLVQKNLTYSHLRKKYNYYVYKYMNKKENKNFSAQKENTLEARYGDAPQ